MQRAGPMLGKGRHPNQEPPHFLDSLRRQVLGWRLEGGERGVETNLDIGDQRFNHTQFLGRSSGITGDAWQIGPGPYRAQKEKNSLIGRRSILTTAAIGAVVLMATALPQTLRAQTTVFFDDFNGTTISPWHADPSGSWKEKGGALRGAVKGKVLSPTFLLPGVFRYSGEVTLTKKGAFSTYVGDLTATYYLIRIDTKHNQARFNWWVNGGRGSAMAKLSGVNYKDVQFKIESDGSHVNFQVSSGTKVFPYAINAVSPSADNSVSKFEMTGGNAAVQWVKVETLP